MSGEIDLENIQINPLNLGLAGFPPHPDIPMLYDVEEEPAGENEDVNSRFYSPASDCTGHNIVLLIPSYLMFYDTTNKDQQIVLKQISSKIPYCKFVEFQQPTETENSQVEIKDEPMETNEIHSEFDIPDLKTELDQEVPDLEGIKSPNNFVINCPINCPECHVVPSSTMTEHFVKQNRPFDETLQCNVCRFVPPTQCSLSAHKRLHDNKPPFICPECGRKFNAQDTLMEHLDDVCFHLAKQVRYRCPARNCGKIFAQTATFSVHFSTHIQYITKCCVCRKTLVDDESVEEHRQEHDEFTHNHICNVCQIECNFTEETIKDHIKKHCTNRSQCVYVYVCKYCKNFFRSTATFATHLLRCPKKELIEDRANIKKIVVTVCMQCKYQIKLLENQILINCPKCGFKFQERFKKEEKYSCILCTKKFSKDGLQNHLSSNDCKYKNPIVVLRDNIKEILAQNNSIEVNETDEESQSFEGRVRSKENDFNKISTVIALENGDLSYLKKESTQKVNDDVIVSSSSDISPRSEDGSKRKRRRGHYSPKFKRSLITEPEVELTVEEPEPFTGTYYCKLCNFTSENRNSFHKHIIIHRDVSTSYQCMECGECFVVKPSLTKHLLFFHQIYDIDTYFEENNCFDEDAITELQEIMRSTPGASKEPVAENQCKVCLEQLEDETELKKHFRIHGMAFLVENTK